MFEDIREQRLKLLENADLPLPELSVENGELIYRGNKWDNMSGSEHISNPDIQARRDSIGDVGYEGNINYELQEESFL